MLHLTESLTHSHRHRHKLVVQAYLKLLHIVCTVHTKHVACTSVLLPGQAVLLFQQLMGCIGFANWNIRFMIAGKHEDKRSTVV